MFMDFGKIVRTLREKKGWTQTELGKRAGVAQNMISRIEKYMMPFFDVACKICDALGVSPSEVWKQVKSSQPDYEKTKPQSKVRKPKSST